MVVTADIRVLLGNLVIIIFRLKCEGYAMPKYLAQGSYADQGLKGLLNDGGSKRRAVVEQLALEMGGNLAVRFHARKRDRRTKMGPTRHCRCLTRVDFGFQAPLRLVSLASLSTAHNPYCTSSGLLGISFQKRDHWLNSSVEGVGRQNLWWTTVCSAKDHKWN
jgi:hypothetical protein